MAKLQSQESHPIHVENSVLRAGRRELSIENAWQTYSEIMLDPVISGSVSFIKSVLGQSFKLENHPDATAREKAVVKALNESLDNLRGFDRHRVVQNWLSSIEYGASLSEVVFKREGGYLVFDTITPIHLTTVNKFTFERGELKKVTLNPAENDGLIENLDTEQTEIEGSKLILTTVQPSLDNPMGCSLLKGCFTSYKQKQILSEYNLISAAKNLSGVLDISVPSEYLQKYLNDPASDEAVYIDSLLQQAEMLHAGKSSFVVTPSDTDNHGQRLFNVSTIGGSSGNAGESIVNGSIDRLNSEMMIALQSSILSLGQDGGGSFALSESRNNLLSVFVKSLQQSIASAFMKAVRLAFQLNGLEDKRLPTVVFEEVDQLNWKEFTEGWQRLIGVGAVRTTPKMEAYFREKGGAPSPENDYDNIGDAL